MDGTAWRGDVGGFPREMVVIASASLSPQKAPTRAQGDPNGAGRF